MSYQTGQKVLTKEMGEVEVYTTKQNGEIESVIKDGKIEDVAEKVITVITFASMIIRQIRDFWKGLFGRK